MILTNNDTGNSNDNDDNDGNGNDTDDNSLGVSNDQSSRDP